MDYQTYNSPQHLPPSFGGPFSAASAAHLAQPTHSSPQQQHFDPHARLQQSNQSFPYGQFTNGQPGGFPTSMGGPASSSGAMMGGGLSQNQLHQARAAALQQQQQQQLSPSPYSSAPYSQPIASPAHQQFIQNRQTASPSSASNQPYATPQQQHQQQQQQQHSPNTLPSNGQQPMNPPSSQPQTSQPMQVHTPVKAVPASPLSPVAQAREKERITTLLEINNLLIKEVSDLHTQGRAGSIGPSPDGKPEGDKQQPSKEYVDCMRRLQANLAYLAQNAEKNHKPNQAILPGPAIMVVPHGPDELVKLYSKLQGLYPGWKGQTNQMKASPGPQRLNSASSQPNSAGAQNSMQPPNSAGLHNNMHPPNSAGLPPNMQLPSNVNSNMNNMGHSMHNMHNMQHNMTQ